MTFVPGMPPDVIVGWLQNDYGQLGRPAEAIAHALVDEGLARRAAYLEPFRAGPPSPAVNRSIIRGLDVYACEGPVPVGRHELAAAVAGASGLERPVLLNCGVAEANWWFHYEFAPICSATVLVTHDKLALWDRMGGRRPLLEALRSRLVAASDAVCGLSEGSIDDLPDAAYVGHGCDELWTHPGVDDAREPSDLAAIPHPRAVYVGALSGRFDADAAGALAQTGVHVVLIGFDPDSAVSALIDREPNVHFLGRRHPSETPAYLLHCDLGLIPHTDEPFTRTMEPHKAYNYACAGLRTAALNIRYAPALGAFLETADDRAGFLAAAERALAAGRLDRADVAQARSLTWGAVAARLLAAAAAAGAAPAVRPPA